MFQFYQRNRKYLSLSEDFYRHSAKEGVGEMSVKNRKKSVVRKENPLFSDNKKRRVVQRLFERKYFEIIVGERIIL